MNNAGEFEHEDYAHAGGPLDIVRGRRLAVAEQSNVELARSEVPVTFDANIDHERVEVTLAGGVVMLGSPSAGAHRAMTIVGRHADTW
jgi:hypothetical protein